MGSPLDALTKHKRENDVAKGKTEAVQLEVKPTRLEDTDFDDFEAVVPKAGPSVLSIISRIVEAGCSCLAPITARPARASARRAADYDKPNPEEEQGEGGSNQEDLARAA